MKPSATPFAQVALPLGARQLFSYSVPPELEQLIEPGQRVRVPFGHRVAFGYVTGFTADPPPGRIRAIQAIDPSDVLFTPEILRLTRWTAEYYLAPWGQVLEAAIPPPARRGGRRRASAAGTPVADLAASDSLTAEAPVSGPAEGSALADATVPFRLEPEQSAAVEAISAALATGGFSAFLLHGVTGSGKTEVYMDAAERVVRAGGSVLFLVPEIAMGTQILSRVERRFAGSVGLFHSQTGDARRFQVWREAREGRLPVVVGTRSAVFVPLPRLRLVVIDEEQEGAYKQEETPRYHGRDVAIVRAQQAGATVVLGSATPSLESLRNVELEKYRLLRLSVRVDGRRPSRVVLVDLNEGRGGSGGGPGGGSGPPGARRGPRTGAASSGPRPPRPVLSPLLLRSVQERLDRGEQSILFLNRRGHSPIVQCADCGAAVGCEQCDVALTFHKADGTLRCHYCGAIVRGVETCPGCHGPNFYYGGVGTQRVEELLREVFPSARIARMDFDAMRRRGAHGDLVRAMEKGEVDILLGTQMVAKGFHFPRVTLVGVIQADREMLQPDFRASERAFQVLTQVAGRAGRGDLPGEVIFQSLMPGHPVIACAAAEDYVGFADSEMASRRALGYPPYQRMLDLLVDGREEGQVRQRAEAVKRVVTEFLGAEGARPAGGRDRIDVLGPAPMPHARLKGRYRWHVTLKGPAAERLHQAARAALDAKAPRGLSQTRLQVDVDPLRME